MSGVGGGQLKVSFAALEAAAADIQGAANQIQARLDRLDRELGPLRADWTGAASEAYQVARARWSQALSDMQQLLGQIGSAVARSNSEYQTAERANQSRW